MIRGVEINVYRMKLVETGSVYCSVDENSQKCPRKYFDMVKFLFANISDRFGVFLNAKFNFVMLSSCKSLLG